VWTLYWCLVCCDYLRATHAAPCNIPKVELRENDVIAAYPSLPTIFVSDPKRNEKLARMTDMDTLLKSPWSDTVQTKLTSSNRYSQGVKKMTLRQYITYTTSLPNTNAANETFYLFGGNVGEPFETFNAAYVLPPCHAIGCDVAGGHSFGLAGRDTGVIFHLHGPVFAENIHGRKRWFLFAPPRDVVNPLFQDIPEAEVNISVSRWVEEVYPRVSLPTNSSCITSSNINQQCSRFNSNGDGEALFYECEVGAGEILFIPSGWKHATLNTDHYNAFMSLFLDLSLIRY